LDIILNEIKEYWDTPEWGFPKGKKNRNENDRECAIREFREETNIESHEIIEIQNTNTI
jgi:8-oxo-dGTP pyrophosphatase MutT (NUDIX family)